MENIHHKVSSSERLTTALTADYGKAIDNQRIQILMGILTTHGKATKETIPDLPDRSAFACTKYQFFLDAPFEIGNQCCHVMKKNPGRTYMKQTGRRPITAQMASESRLRTQVWLRQGCNAFDAKKPVSNPMSFWTEQDVLLYIWKYKLPICSVYGDVVLDYEGDGQIQGQMSFRDLGGDWELFDTDRPLLKTTGCQRTGCVFCGFGCHLEKPGDGRFEKLKRTHPKLYNYVFKPWDEGGLGYKEVIDWINEHGGLNIKY